MQDDMRDAAGTLQGTDLKYSLHHNAPLSCLGHEYRHASWQSYYQFFPVTGGIVSVICVDKKIIYLWNVIMFWSVWLWRVIRLDLAFRWLHLFFCAEPKWFQCSINSSIQFSFIIYFMWTTCIWWQLTANLSFELNWRWKMIIYCNPYVQKSAQSGSVIMKGLYVEMQI